MTAFSSCWIPSAFRDRELSAHTAQALREGTNEFEQTGILEQIPEDVLTVIDRLNARQWRVKERLQIVLFPSSGNRIDNLVEIEIGKEVRRLLPLNHSFGLWCVEQNTSEGRSFRG